MKYLILMIVLLVGAVIVTAVDRVLGVEVKSQSNTRNIVHRVLLMSQGGIILLLLFHF